MVITTEACAPRREEDLAGCEIVTKNAAGEIRRYHIDLTNDDTFDDGYLMAGKRIDDHDYDRSPDAPSQAAWDAARGHFRERGFDVHES